MEHTDAIDRKEDKLYGPDKTDDELPEDIRDPEKRIQKLKELKKKLDAGGREKINKTDSDAAFMKTQNGIKTSYNAQVSVDAEHQVIVAAAVTNQVSNVEQLLPMVRETEGNVSEKVQKCSADSGYSSGENIQAMQRREIDAYIPDREYQAQQRCKKIDEFQKDNFIYDDQSDCYISPQGKELIFSHFQKR